MATLPNPDWERRGTTLQQLTGDTSRLWHDAAVRAAAIEGIVQAWQRDDPAALDATLRRVDHAVAAILAALELPRGPVGRLRFEPVGHGWVARKEPGCDLVFDADEVWAGVRHDHLPDDLFCTWLHESIHARQPCTPDYFRESTEARGYEEGLAEGLARLIARLPPGLDLRQRQQDYFVAAYETLAEALTVSVVTLWLHVWPVPPGAVRRQLPEIIADIREQRTGSPLARPRILIVGNRADAIFATRLSGVRQVDRALLRSRWEEVLT